jgi:hypothetical protein
MNAGILVTECCVFRYSDSTSGGLRAEALKKHWPPRVVPEGV